MKKDKKEKINLKNKILDIVPILAILIIVFFVAIMVSNNKNISKTVKIKEISYSELEEKIKEDTFNIVLIGRTDCSHCVNYKPIINQAGNQYNFDILYINTDNLTVDDYIKIHDSVKVLKDQFDSEGNPGIPTPVTVIYRNGFEINSILGELNLKKLENFLSDSGVIKK